MMKRILILLTLTVALASANAKPLKVFILAGQSNMEGHAEISTFDYIGKDPLTAPLLKEMRNTDGTPRVCDNVWMSYLTGPYDGSANGEGLGKLTAGFGERGGKLHSEAPFCCSIRGGEGIARAIQYSYFQDKNTVVLPFYSNGTATLRFAEGTCKVRQETGYPHKGQVRLEVLESQVNKEKKWRFFVPSWAVRESFEIRVNGKKAEPRLADSFAEIAVPLVAGTVVEVAFQQERGPRPAVQAALAPGATRYFDGPLLLGSATENADEPLTPILDLLAAGGRGGEPYVYFPNKKSQPAARTAAARKSPNLAEQAQVFRRDLSPDQVPAEVGKLFTTLKHDVALAIMGFVWSKPQNVRQVILQWPESGAMPKPEEIALRWSDAGELHTAAQPGIIGNGRQWIYTLGKAPEGVAVDHLVLAGKSVAGILDALAVPEVEVIGGNQDSKTISK